MPISCLKCGYENPETPTDTLAACPKCGAIYLRVAEHQRKLEATRAAEESARKRETEARANAERKRADARAASQQDAAEAQRRKLLGPGYFPPQAGQPAIKSPSIVKVYKGSHRDAMAAFQLDAQAMAVEGYVPTSQQWAPGTYGCASFIVALLLCVLIVGLLVFIYMLLVKPPGTLSVTFELRPTQTEAVPAAAPTTPGTSEKICPQCAEQVKSAAKVCRFCGHRFDANEA